MTLLKDLEPYERAVWSALQTGDPSADRALLSSDFLGAYPDGFHGRDAHAGQLDAGPTVGTYTLSQLQARALGPDHGLLTYQADYTRPGVPEIHTMYVSSLWQRTETGWTNIFSQDTPAAT